jgi:integration host factor subunit beta
VLDDTPRSPGDTVTKSDLVERVHARTPHLPKRDVELAVNCVFDAMTEALSEDERIEIRGFGSFTIKHRKARDGRNPKTGARVFVPDKRVPFFTVGKELRERVNDGHPARTNGREDG